jgi:hypothetical protein
VPLWQGGTDVLVEVSNTEGITFVSLVSAMRAGNA